MNQLINLNVNSGRYGQLYLPHQLQPTFQLKVKSIRTLSGLNINQLSKFTCIPIKELKLLESNPNTLSLYMLTVLCDFFEVELKEFFI